MFDKIFRQQIMIFKLGYRGNIVAAILAVLAGLTPLLSLIDQSKNEFDSAKIFSTVINIYPLSFILFTTCIITSVLSLSYRFADIYVLRSRGVTWIQFVVSNILRQVINWSFWLFGALISIVMTGNTYFLFMAGFHFVLILILILVTMILLGQIANIIWILSNNKALAILITVGLNLFLYYLNYQNINGIIFYFANPKSIFETIINLTLMLLILAISTLLFKKIIQFKDFI